ncbi:hypothetical protein ID866_11852 [Astraeus odoratus]|nr:hypothetical protein ID866_11852 [Astraeus odoratus]
MPSSHYTLSPHEILLVKTKAPCEHTEEEWQLVSEAECQACKEAEKKAQEEAKQKAQEEAERKAEEEHKAQGEVARAKEEAEKIAKEATEREEAAKRAAEAAEERADAERRALKERLWEVAGQQSEMVVAPPWVAKPSRRMTMGGPSTPGWRVSGVQHPCTRCHNKGTLCILGTAKGKTMACEACHHMKASCSWKKRMTREMQKQKWVQQLEETEDVKMIEVGEDGKEEEVQSHFTVPTHLAEDHQDALRALTATLDKLSMDFLAFWLNNLKEEEMGKSKGKGKEKAKEEFRRLMTDDDRDMEMGRAGPSSLA